MIDHTPEYSVYLLETWLCRLQRWLALALLLGGAVLLPAQLARAAVDSTGTGAFYLTDDQGVRRPAVHLHSRAEMDIKGMSARVVLHQTFTNDSDGWVEGVYVFPLPDDSAVNFMRLHIGERTITGKVRERAQARAEYQAARRQGRRAALTEQERPNLFTQSVANIAPGETLSVELHYVQSVRFDSGQFRLRLPMTLTPRFMPGAPAPLAEDKHLRPDASGWALPTTAVPDANRISPRYHPPESPGQNRMELLVRLEAGMPLASVDSATHELVLRRLSGPPGVHEIRFARGDEPMDRDFELTWRPEAGQAPEAAVFRERHAGDDFVQLMLVPPQGDGAAQSSPRQLTLVIDTSGSMRGNSIAQARESLLLALNNLAPGDRFNVIEFNSAHSSLFPSAVPADRHNVNLARRFVQRLRAGGGTVMIPPLRDALQAGAEGYVQQLVFVTDGAVGNEGQVLEMIERRLGKATLFTVGIGSAPNSYFMRQAAKIGRGTHTHISTSDQVVERMGELFKKLEHPAVTDLAIDWPSRAETYPARLPDVYLGEPLFVHARLFDRAEGESTLTVTGKTQGQSWRRELSLPPAGEPGGEGTPALASQWAREKIGALLDGNLGRAHGEKLREQVLAVALPFQLLSPYTSFVAIEEQPSRPRRAGLDTESVLNQLPDGQTAARVVYPQTATGVRGQLLAGLLILLAALLLYGLGEKRRER